MFAKQSAKRLPFVAGLMMAAALAAPAQMQQPGSMPGNPGGTPGGTPGAPPSASQGQPGAPGMANPSADSPVMRMQNMQDGEFVQKVLADNDAQVQLSQLAQQKATSDDVKQFSEKMVQIHTELNQQMQPLAKKLDVSKPKKLDKKEKKELAQLQSLSGPAFDKAYIQDMAAAQQQGLKLFTKEAKTGEQTGVALTAQKDEPILEQHFAVLKKIAAAHNVPLESGKKK
jgi:putative membrane protein